MKSFRSLDNPVVIAQTQTGKRLAAPLAQTGAFALSVPVGEVVKLTVANTVARGSLREISTIKWPGVWQRVGAGAPIMLGGVRAKGSAASTAADGGSSSGHGGHDSDDGDDHDGDHGGDCKDGGSDHDGTRDGGLEDDDDDDCAGVSCEKAEVCEESDAAEADCDHDDFDGVTAASSAPASATCTPPAAPVTPLTPITTTTPNPVGTPPRPCTVNADCAAGQACFQSVCVALN